MIMACLVSRPVTFLAHHQTCFHNFAISVYTPICYFLTYRYDKKTIFVQWFSVIFLYPRYRATWPRGVQISWHSAHEGGKFFTSTHRPPLPIYSFLEAESTPGTWTYRMPRKKSPVTRLGIDPWTFQLVARLNRYTTRGPSSANYFQ